MLLYSIYIYVFIINYHHKKIYIIYVFKVAKVPSISCNYIYDYQIKFDFTKTIELIIYEIACFK